MLAPTGGVHCPESSSTAEKLCSPADHPNFPMFQPAAPIPQAVYCCWPVSLHQHMPLQRHVSVCDLSRNLQGSLGHQVFRLVSHLCWGAQRNESGKLYHMLCSHWCPSAISCPPTALRCHFCGTIRRWARLATGEGSTLMGGSGLSLYPSTLHSHANNIESSGGVHACVQHSEGQEDWEFKVFLPNRF